MAVSEELQRKIAERRAAREAEQAEQVAKVVNPSGDFSAYADLIPKEEYERSEEDKKLDVVLSSIDIVTAYRKWINKSPVKESTKQKDGIKVSCPKPGHADKNPSAWLNTEKNVWYCGSCSEGGDIYDLAAFYHGYPVPGYKDGATFHELRRVIAGDFGYSFVSIPGSSELAMVESSPSEPVADPDHESPVSPPVAAPPTLSVVPNGEPTPDNISDADVIDMYGNFGTKFIKTPELDWREIVPKNTFLETYMKITSQDDVVEEFHFWNAMTILGFAVGRDVRMFDRVPVMANLFICTLGDSGTGKSQAKYHMTNLLDAALKFDPMDIAPKGVKIVNTPGSAEVLISQFEHRVYDPSSPKKVMFSSPVRGLIEFNELAALTGRASRMGNVLKPTLMDFYDGTSVISTSSLTSGIKEARDAFASAHTTTQPKAISKLLHQGDSDSGFLNRWFFVGGKGKERVAIGGKTIDMGPAVMPLQAVRDHYAKGTVPKILPWTQEAADRYTEFFHGTLVPLKASDESGLLTRIDLFYKKLILLFTINLTADEIPLEAVEQAILMYQYILDCYQIPSDKLGDTVLSLIRDDILEFAKKAHEKGKSVTIGEISKYMARRKHQIDMVKKALDLMVYMGELSSEVANKGAKGRPTVRFSYVG